MKKVEEFQKTEKLIEEYKGFSDKISGLEEKLVSNKDANETKLKELENQLEIKNKKSAEKIKKLESQLQMTFSDAEFEIDRAALQEEINKQIEAEKEDLAKESKEINKEIKSEKENLVEENKKVESRIKEEKDNKKYFRTDANLRTITMEIEEMKKEVAKCKLELAKKDLELREFYAEGKPSENKFKWQEIYNEQDEIKNDMNALNSKIEEYSNFKNELLSITLTPNEYKEMYAREERKEPNIEEKTEKLWNEINESIDQNIEDGEKATSTTPEVEESKTDIIDEVNNSIEENMGEPEIEWQDISSNSVPVAENNSESEKHYLHIKRKRKNIEINGMEFSKEEIAEKKKALENTKFKEEVEWLKEYGDMDILAAMFLRQDKITAENREDIQYHIKDYIEMIQNPSSKENSTVDISYNLKSNDGMLKRIKGFFKNREDFKELKNEAFKAKYYAKVKAPGFTEMQLKLQKAKEKIEKKLFNKSETPKLLTTGREEAPSLRERLAVPVQDRRQPESNREVGVEQIRDDDREVE